MPEIPTSTISDYYEAYWSTARPLINIGPAPDALIDPLRPLVSSSSTVLDFGCGDGVTLGTWLVAHAGAYVGVDVSTAAIQQARDRGLDARVMPVDGRLPFEDASFDVAVSVEVLEHMFAPQVALGEIRRVLRPGGVVFVTVPNVAYWRRRADLFVLGRWNPVGDTLSVQQPWRDPHVRFFNRRALARLLAGSGFEQVVVRGHGGALLAELPIARILARPRRSSPLYRLAEQRFPGLFGGHLNAVGRVPA